jgi:hypothetical protein
MINRMFRGNMNEVRKERETHIRLIRKVNAKMNKYNALWEHIQNDGKPPFKLTFSEIQEIAGILIDHSFLNFKKELPAYGYQVGQISMKEQTVAFSKPED